MYICLHCKAIFDEAEIDEGVIDRHPYGEGHASEYKCCCPECGSFEISEAFECTECGEWFPVDERNFHPYTELDVCEDCYFGITHAYETSPYHDCDNVFDALDAMIGAYHD